ncbi:MAG: AF1514 family protein [Deltaproteobacteria bacterium]|nr:AF1514 family protein [Deltaproteobacteria bacterium]
MVDIEVAVQGLALDYEAARKIAQVIAGKDGEEPMLMAWSDRDRGKHSPACVKCELRGTPGWEVYGRNHGGRLRISINNDCYVFIYS